MRYLAFTLKTATKFLIRAALFTLLALITFAFLTTCTQKPCKKEIDIEAGSERSWADDVNEHMSAIEEAAADEDEEDEPEGGVLGLPGGSSKGSGRGFSL